MGRRKRAAPEANNDNVPLVSEGTEHNQTSGSSAVESQPLPSGIEGIPGMGLAGEGDNGNAVRGDSQGAAPNVGASAADSPGSNGKATTGGKKRASRASDPPPPISGIADKLTPDIIANLLCTWLVKSNTGMNDGLPDLPTQAIPIVYGACYIVSVDIVALMGKLGGKSARIGAWSIVLGGTGFTMYRRDRKRKQSKPAKPTVVFTAPSV